MKITDENRRAVAKYLADYIDQEMELLEPPWEADRMIEVLESGLEAYESINQPKQYAVSLGTHGLTLNGQAFLLSVGRKVRLLDSIAEAKEWAKAIGMSCCDVYEYLPESEDYVAVAQNEIG